MNKYETLGRIIEILTKKNIKNRVCVVGDVLAVNVINLLGEYGEFESLSYIISDNEIIQRIVWDYAETENTAIEKIEKFWED